MAKKTGYIHSIATIVMTLSLSGCVFCLDENNRVTTNCPPKNDISKSKLKTIQGGFPVPTEFSMKADNDQPGQSTSFSGSALIPTKSLQTFDATVRFPPDFTISPNGFLNNGPTGSQVGSYNVDIDNDGLNDGVFPIKSESVFFAWLDINNNNIKDFFEPDVFQSQDMSGNKLLVINLPVGGDNNALSNTGSTAFRMGLELNSGLIINPAIPTSHQITATINSVDPDTGGANNGSGIAPQILMLETTLIVKSLFENGFE